MKGELMLYKDWLSEWLIHYVQPSVKEKTFQRYGEMIRNHINPAIGKHEMNEISPLMVQRFVTELLQSGNIKTGKGLSAYIGQPHPGLMSRSYCHRQTCNWFSKIGRANIPSRLSRYCTKYKF